MAESNYNNEQEGSDITFADMVEGESELLKFYKDSTILITGGTGYLGKLAMEKLLRSCDVKKIFLLVRSKKGKDPQTRFEEMFNEPSFDPLKRINPNFTDKLQLVNGDAMLPQLGMSEEDIEMLQAEVEVVLHFAATVRFDEKLRIATYINVRGVRDILDISSHMKNLKAFIHVSTAYSNCIHSKIEEKFYEPPVDGNKLITLMDCLDDKHLDAITNTLIGDYPNTYTFTKCIAEDLVRSKGQFLPIAVHRPSIVIATVKEPVAGWINNVYGATGVLLGVAVGLLRTLHGKQDNRADMVPADYVVNCILAVAWDIASLKATNENKEVRDKESREEKLDKEMQIYNYVSTCEKPITWRNFRDLSTKYATRVPSEKVIWHSYFRMRESKWAYLITKFLLHTVPAHAVDFIAVCIGKKPMLVKGYEKINKFADVLAYFCLRQWEFSNQNVQSLWNRLNKTDKVIFEFSMKQLDWELYFNTYMRGGRVYIIKDPLDTIPQGRKKYIKLMIAHYTLVVILFAVFIKFLMIVFNFIF